MKHNQINVQSQPTPGYQTTAQSQQQQPELLSAMKRRP